MLQDLSDIYLRTYQRDSPAPLPGIRTLTAVSMSLSTTCAG